MNISHSALRDYLHCPLLFWYRRVAKIKLPPTKMPLHFGKSLHRALELYHAKGRPLAEVFKEEFIPDLLDEKDMLKYEDHMKEGLSLLEYYEKNDTAIEELYTGKIKKTEEYFKIPSNKVKFENITGVVDFVTSTEKLGDYKTSARKYTQKMVDESHQPTFYYLWYLEKYKELPKSFLYVIFLKNRKRERIQVLETTRTKEDIDNLIKLINEVHSKVEANQFDRGHDATAFCDCYAYEEIVGL